jgi:uncharacterized coiled-coil protein SlyX/cbb3-type cytochrome oxidase subunit 3
MRKPVVWGLAALSVLLAGATAVIYSKYQKTSAAYAQVVADEESTRVRYGQAINEIGMIQDSLNAIVLGQDAARLIPSQLQTELSLSETRGDEALARIGVLKAGIQRTKDRIEHLDATLKKNGIKIAGLEKTIARLKKQVVEKEELVAQLSGQVQSLETQVTGLVAEVEVKDKELGTIFYTIGSRKELTHSGVVVAKGGVLGLGKTLKPSGQANDYAFTALDTDQETVIRIPADKVQVLSAQPVSSYVLQPAGENMVELRILDPKEFRKIKHLVIMTA